MKPIFQFSDYREYLTYKIESLPAKGHGQLSKLSQFMGAHTSLMSQVLKGHKSLTPDQAVGVTEFFGLAELETEYFILLVLHDRTATPQAKTFFQSKLESLRQKSNQIKNRVKVSIELSEEDRACFYSHWTYSAIRQLVALPHIKTADHIALALHLPVSLIHKRLQFLLEVGLCRLRKGSLDVGHASTHVGADSPWVNVHHQNWRNRALEAIGHVAPENLHYTCPLTISAKDAQVIREKLVQLVSEVNEVIDSSSSEEAYCFNFDWFKLET